MRNNFETQLPIATLSESSDGHESPSANIQTLFPGIINWSPSGRQVNPALQSTSILQGPSAIPHLQPL